MNERESRRWNVALAAALVAGATGIALNNTAVFLSATVGFTYAVYGFVSRPPTAAVDVERTLSDPDPVPGSEIEVTVTVTNAGDAQLPDVRIVDGVPETLPVISGSPRHGTALRAGESESFSYALPARRGEHEFGETVIVARNLGGGSARRATRRVETPVVCRAAVESPPLAARTTNRPGRLATDTGGEGIEFHATRQYYPGDSMRRINWKRYARTRELTTVEFRESRAATVMVLVDRRDEARIVRAPNEPDAVDLGAYAAARIADALLARNDSVGVALYEERGAVLSPAADGVQDVRIARLLDEGPGALVDETRLRSNLRTVRTEKLLKHLPNASQVILVSPLLDDGPVETATRLAAHGHPVTVVSPDVTTGATPGGTVAGLDRARRLAAVRGGGLRAVDWSPDRPLDAATELATRGGTR